ncbi:MAG: hypothetical protein HZA64_09700, partial [Rhodocyclales bacterium]|nr:hypothetical protein [Rhodocyclales bacterium]
MISGLLKKIFGSRNDRLIKQYSQTVSRINALEPALQALTDEQLRAKTDEFRARLAQGEALDDLLPEAFAVVREAGKRSLGMRHFDVQMIGGMVLHNNKIAEMRTGEGKTLVATLPAYLNALTGKGVHIVTVNDYLASRDAEWMGRLHKFLGLTVGVNLSQMAHDRKQEAYAADITYGTNNEFGFDYLRDNMVYTPGERVQRGLAYAIVDEVDSILIDEARTPLIISGQAEDHTELYVKMNALPPLLTKGEAAKSQEDVDTGDYTVDLKSHQVLLTEEGHEKAERILAQMGLLAEGASLYEPANILLMHHLYAALRAHNLFHRDQQYVVQNGEVVIVDEVDSILVDEARTPLIISVPLDDRSEFYNTIDSYIPALDKTDYEVDEKQRTVTLTEAGMEKLEQRLRDAGQLKGESLYDVENVSVVHHVNQALRAHKLFQRDKDYIVRNGEVVIIDEFTGRMMPGRRYSEGLHQALEAKEH